MSFLLIALIPNICLSQKSIPHLSKTGNTKQLIVDGKPFLVLGGELFNNSATDLEFLENVWSGLKQKNLNTVLTAVAWAQLEPTEGKFNYEIVDGVIEQARKHNMRLVLLWFGSWKNTWSSYAPDWVKRDFKRFPRVQLSNGFGTERLSPFSEENQKADARAYAALMRHLKDFDGKENTVLMVQVENEVGVIPDARDHSEVANKAYANAVPRELMNYLVKNRETIAPELREKWMKTGFETSGSWEKVFGPGLETEDLFMAWHYANYIGKVAEAGKAEYNLPMFTNAALIRTNYAPGQYNSGGPLPHSIDIWRAGGPQLDFLVPDIYFGFKEWSDKFVRNNNPLFVPEMAGGATGAADVFYAIGHNKAIGVSPFGIDGLFTTNDPLGNSYAVLSQLAPLILDNQTKGNVEGVVLGTITPSQRIQLGGYTLNIQRSGGAPAANNSNNVPMPDPHGIFIAAGPDEFYMAGSGLSITFSSSDGASIVGLAKVEEGRFVDGKWKPGRLLAGDDTGQGNNVSLRSTAAGILHVTVYKYK